MLSQNSTEQCVLTWYSSSSSLSSTITLERALRLVLDAGAFSAAFPAALALVSGLALQVYGSSCERLDYESRRLHDTHPDAAQAIQTTHRYTFNTHGCFQHRFC